MADVADITAELIGKQWHYSDGTVLPAARGGDGEADDGAGDDADDAGMVITDDDAGQAAPEAGAAVDPFDDPANATFDRTYVERLRAEAAERRVTAKPYVEAFDGYDDGDREVLLDLARTLREDPKAAAEWMQAQAEAILGDSADAPGPIDEPADDSAPMTKAQLEQYLSEREAKTRSAEDANRQVEAIVSEAKALGFDPEADRPGYLILLDIANTQTGGDLAKAATIAQARNQKIIDDYLAGKSKDADISPRTTPQAGSGRETPKKPADWDDLGAQVRAEIEALKA